MFFFLLVWKFSDLSLKAKIGRKESGKRENRQIPKETKVGKGNREPVYLITDKGALSDTNINFMFYLLFLFVCFKP